MNEFCVVTVKKLFGEAFYVCASSELLNLIKKLLMTFESFFKLNFEIFNN